MRNVALAALLCLTGCATAINGRWESVPVDSFPSGAKVVVACGKAPADGGVTPARVKLERREANCRLTLSKDGYQSQEVVFERQMSRATDANRIAAAPVGIVAAVGLALLIPDWFMDDADVVGGGFAGGIALGSAPANQVDKHLGGAYKQVPGELFVILIRERPAPER